MKVGRCGLVLRAPKRFRDGVLHRQEKCAECAERVTHAIEIPVLKGIFSR